MDTYEVNDKIACVKKINIGIKIFALWTNVLSLAFVLCYKQMFHHGLFEHDIVFMSFESVKSPVSMALLQTLYEPTVSWHIVF